MRTADRRPASRSASPAPSTYRSTSTGRPSRACSKPSAAAWDTKMSWPRHDHRAGDPVDNPDRHVLGGRSTSGDHLGVVCAAQRDSAATPIPRPRPRLLVDDIVSFDDDFGNLWTGGQVTAIRPEGIYVRWPDAVIGTFAHRHTHRLKRAA